MSCSARRSNGLAHLGAEAGPAERHGVAGDRLTVQPGRATRRDLSVDRGVRPHGERDAAAPLCVIERPQLDNGAEWAVAGGVEITELVVGALPQLLRDQRLSPGAHPFLDVIAGDDEVLAVVGDATHDDVDVRVLGVPVIYAHPVELRAEILLHPADQLSGEPLEVGHVGRVLG
jgi:hypothetical protein